MNSYINDAGRQSARSNYQKSVLDQLTQAQQIDVLKFAHSHDIKPDDPTWLLVELLGHVRYNTDTLPARIEAAAENAVQAIAQQRQLEQRAFSANAMRELDKMLNVLSRRVVEESRMISDRQIHRRLMANSLTAISGVTLLMSICTVCGYVLASNKVYWIKSSDQPLVKALSVFFNLPVGYLIFPGVIFALGLWSWYWWGNSNK